MTWQPRAPRSIGKALMAAMLATCADEMPGRAEAPGSTVPAASPLRSTIAQIAARVATDLGSTVKDPSVFVALVRSDETLSKASELGGKLGALVAGAMGGGSTFRGEPVGLATAQALSKAKSLVYLQMEISRGQVQVNADAYRTLQNVWERARQPSPVPIGHSFAGGRIDGEVRAYMVPVPLVAGSIDRVGIDERDLVAIACGDTGNAGLELVTLSRRRIAVGRVRGGHLVVRKSIPLRDVSAVAPSPLREPVGGIAIIPAQGARPAFIDVGITDRARGVRLDADLHVLGPIAGVPFATPNGDGCATFQGITLDVAVASCAEGDVTLDSSAIETPFDAAGAATYVTPQGVARAIFATRDPRTADLKVRADEKTTTLARSGAQVAVADLDQDGSPEIISTLDVLPQPSNQDADALVISSWQPDGSLRERARTSVPSGVRALAACPPEGNGRSAVIVATQGELWIVH